MPDWAAHDGHRYLPEPNLVADAAKILDVPAELIAPCLDELAAAEGVVLAGSRRALAAAVRTKGACRHHTALAHRCDPAARPMS